MKKYRCNPMFDKETWKVLLNNLGVKAEILGEEPDGWFLLEFDEEAFKKFKPHELPHFLWLNRPYMLKEED